MLGEVDVADGGKLVGVVSARQAASSTAASIKMTPTQINFTSFIRIILL